MTKLDRVVEALRAGEPVILATDTVYGLAAAADRSEAVSRIFALKNRPVDVHMAVLVADPAQARAYVDLGRAGEALAAEFWPGPLTIVAPRRDDGALAAGDDDTIGVRCPDEPFVREVATAVGPIAATSANLHGEPTPTTAQEVAACFPGVTVVVDGGARSGAASTVVTVAGPEPVVLREGPIGEAEIAAVVRRAP